MRVITGSARGRKLQTPPGLETRPTSEMVKEAVFSMIQFEIEGARVLDLFSGSGQMGIEALSRGAASCVFVDNARAAWQAISANLDATGFAGRSRLVKSDAMPFLASLRDRFDIVFLDPPYDSGFAAKALPLLAEAMTDSGVVLLETAAREEAPANAGDFGIHKRYRYGKTAITQYRRQTAAD